MSRVIASTGINRRMALKVMMLTGSGVGLAGNLAGNSEAATLEPRPGAVPRGTPSDPDLVNPVVPWDRTLSGEALATLAVLVDVILPADEHTPAASELDAHHFIDEWVSAPYERQQRDNALILEGLAWLDAESERRFDVPFADLSATDRTAICDDICYLPKASAEHQLGAKFFARVRNLAAAAVWTTEAGLEDLRYQGNVPLPKWELPPAAVLQHLGLDKD